MNLKLIWKECWVFAGLLAVSGLSWRAEAAEEEGEEYAFREELYFSELQKDAGYAQAVRVGGVVLVSATTAPGDTFDAQLKAAYVRVQATLGHYGLKMKDVVQERIYTLDMDALQKALEIRTLYYHDGTLPAVSWLEVSQLPEEGRMVAIELMAVVSEEE